VAGCDHDTPERFRVCPHLLEGEDTGHLQRFTGRGVEHELVCKACVEGSSELLGVCAACRDAAAEGGWIGIAGAPEIAEEASPLWFDHRRVELHPRSPPLADAQPVLGPDRNCWIGVTGDGQLFHLDLDRPAARPLAQVPEGALDLEQPLALRLSRDARLAAVVNRQGTRGVVVDLETGRPTLTLARDGYCAEHCEFPVAFLERGGRTLVVHSPEWNRLDVVCARTGELLTGRGPTSYARGEPRPPHYLDYFHCGLAVSPDQRHIADNGWVWHPVGIVAAWSIDRWLDDNAWESEDGPSKRGLCWRDYHWDGPVCWLDGDRLAVWGYGADDQWLLPAVRIFDVRSGTEERWFPGPRGPLFFDRLLVSVDEQQGASVWSVERGARLLRDRRALPARYHPTAKAFITLPAEGATVSRLCGHDAGAAWNGGVIAELARSIARDRSFDDLPVLGDALEAAGCPDAEMLAHCQRPGPHAERCWVLDRLARE
jgi:hypothetical protein